MTSPTTGEGPTTWDQANTAGTATGVAPVQGLAQSGESLTPIRSLLNLLPLSLLNKHAALKLCACLYLKKYVFSSCISSSTSSKIHSWNIIEHNSVTLWIWYGTKITVYANVSYKPLKDINETEEAVGRIVCLLYWWYINSLKDQFSHTVICLMDPTLGFKLPHS